MIRLFIDDEKGVIAPLFAIVAIVLVAFVGMSVDVGRAYKVKHQLSTTLDAAILAIARDPELAQMSKTERDNFISKYFNAHQRTNNLAISFNTTLSEEGILTATAETEVPTAFMRLALTPKIDVNVLSEAIPFSGKAEIALVLDTTDSMNDANKLADMKTAAKKLVENLINVPNAEDKVKFAVVPFSNKVNVGMDTVEPWLNIPDPTSPYSWEYQTYCMNDGPSDSQCSDWAGACSSGAEGAWCNPERRFCSSAQCGGGDPVCTNQTPSADECNTWLAKGPEQFEGCVEPRKNPHHLTDQFGLDEQKYEGNIGWCGSKQLLELTTSESEIKTKIDSLTGTDETYIPIGLSFGWHVLSKQEPENMDEAYTSAEPKSNKEWTKNIILMTDGHHEKPNLWDWITGQKADIAMKKLCTNIKADGVRIFTIAFAVTDANIKALLKNCASEPGNFYEASDGVNLSLAFENIGQNISQVRLSK